MTADVVVIGAGIMGASATWHLSALGVRDLLVVDAGSGPGEGSPRRATGGFRTQFATGVNVRLSLRSRAKLASFHDETGGDAGYRPVGYLFLATSEAELGVLREAQRVQHAEGLREVVLLAPRRSGGSSRRSGWTRWRAPPGAPRTGTSIPSGSCAATSRRPAARASGCALGRRSSGWSARAAG